MIIEEIYTVIKQRKKDMPGGSYSTFLFEEGDDKIMQKIGEETTEVIIAGKNKNRKRIIEEISDLFYMILIFLVNKNISLEEIFQELKKRRK